MSTAPKKRGRSDAPPPPFPPHYLEKLIESSPDIVVAIDRAGRIVFYNDGAEKNLGYSSEETLGHDVDLIYPSLDEAKRVMRAMRDDDFGGPGKLKNFETTFVDRWGIAVPVAISGSILFDDDGLEIGSIGFAKDIRELRRRDRLVTLGEVAVAVCHQINNPLEVILNQTALLRTYARSHGSAQEDADAEARVESVRGEVEKIQQIVNRLVALSKGEAYGTKEYHGGTRMADLEPVPAPPPSAERSLEGIRALVVDDDLGVCFSLRDLLVAEGCQVLTAGTGLEALKVLEHAQVDVIVSDVVMPDLDGYDLYMEVKEHSDIPVVLMTGYYYDRDHVIKRSRLEGLDNVLFKKPVDPERLKKVIRQVCGREPAAAAS